MKLKPFNNISFDYKNQLEQTGVENTKQNKHGVIIAVFCDNIHQFEKWAKQRTIKKNLNGFYFDSEHNKYIPVNPYTNKFQGVQYNQYEFIQESMIHRTNEIIKQVHIRTLKKK